MVPLSQQRFDGDAFGKRRGEVAVDELDAAHAEAEALHVVLGHGARFVGENELYVAELLVQRAGAHVHSAFVFDVHVQIILDVMLQMKKRRPTSMKKACSVRENSKTT